MRKRNLLLGCGINDADYPLYIVAHINGVQKNLWRCPFYGVWSEMLIRCYSKKSQASRPTYVGCSVTNEWLKFSVFRAWMVTQPWEGKHLDKDILITGNKVYGPDTCVFVSGALNKFLTDSRAARGEWPNGVHWRKDQDRWQAYCNNPFTGKREHLGYFDSPQDAHEAWRECKHKLSCLYADKQDDHRIAEALRTRFI